VDVRIVQIVVKVVVKMDVLGHALELVKVHVKMDVLAYAMELVKVLVEDIIISTNSQ
jgi:hypothetical protein